MINVRALAGADYSDRQKYVELYFEQSGSPALSIYADSANIPTIGIGFNLRTPTVLDAVARHFNINIDTNQADISYRNRLAQVFASNSPTTWQADANAIMAERAAVVGGGARTTFTFTDTPDVFGAFDRVIPTYESEANNARPKRVRRASQIGLASSTRRPTAETILLTMRSRCASSLNRTAVGSRIPCRST